jgi:hypothetical protein
MGVSFGNGQNPSNLGSLHDFPVLPYQWLFFMSNLQTTLGSVALDLRSRELG